VKKLNVQHRTHFHAFQASENSLRHARRCRCVVHCSLVLAYSPVSFQPFNKLLLFFSSVGERPTPTHPLLAGGALGCSHHPACPSWHTHGFSVCPWLADHPSRYRSVYLPSPHTGGGGAYRPTLPDQRVCCGSCRVEVSTPHPVSSPSF